jgi:hypothetical protein
MRSRRCLVCGRSHDECHLDNLVIIDNTSEARMAKQWRSRERVYDTDVHGISFLKYPVGALIPEDEARRQGLVDAAESKAVTPPDGGDSGAQDKAVAPPANTGVKAPVPAQRKTPVAKKAPVKKAPAKRAASAK